MRESKEMRNQGITLIGLVVTIVVLLILAAISISMLSGENGIISQAKKAREEQEIGKEKELINLAYTGLKAGDINRQITEEDMENEINNINGAGTVDVTGQGTLNIKFLESNRSYLIDVATGKVQQNNKELEELVGEAYALILADNTMVFMRSESPIVTGDSYEGKEVVAAYTGIETDVYTFDGEYPNSPWTDYMYDITSVFVKDEISPISTAVWFCDFESCSSFALTKLNTGNTTNMSYMFAYTDFEKIIGLGNLDTSSVMNMSGMFMDANYGATSVDIGDINNWDTSSVTDMSQMFSGAYKNVEIFKLDLSNWDTSSVTYMDNMFRHAGYNNLDNKGANTFKIIGLDNWDTSSVTNMSGMFNCAGTIASTWDIGDLSNWDVKKVETMSWMFNNAGRNASIFDVGDIRKWDTSKVVNMSYMFNSTGLNAAYTLDLSSWKVPLVTSYNKFNYSIESKVIAPTWVN